MAEKTNKRAFLPNVRVGSPGMDIAALRTLAQNEPQAFAGKVQTLIDDGKFTWSHVRRLDRLYDALSDVQVPVTLDTPSGSTRAVMASAFPILTGGLSIAAINAAYTEVPTIGQDLVTEMDDNKKVSIVAGVLALDNQIDRVDEGETFPEIGASAESYHIHSKRNGRRLSITAEAIEENDIAGITGKLNALGRIAGESVEVQTLRRVCDIDGSATSPAEPYVLHLNGSGAALYQTDADPLTRLGSSGNRYTTNPLVDTTDLDNVRIRLAANKNDLGYRISIPPSQCVLLVPTALEGTARKILGSEYEPGVENEINNWGPRGAYRPRLITSPKLDDLSTTAWYYGDFARQFTRKWKLRFEYATLGSDTESYLRSRLAAQFRVAWDVEIGAIDYVYVIQSLAATTAP